MIQTRANNPNSLKIFFLKVQVEFAKICKSLSLRKLRNLRDLMHIIVCEQFLK